MQPHAHITVRVPVEGSEAALLAAPLPLLFAPSAS